MDSAYSESADWRDGQQDGTTMIELMFWSIVIVIFLGALLTITVRQGNHRRINQDSMLAVTAALDNLERVRNAEFGTVLSLDGTDFDVPATNGAPKGLRPVSGDPDGFAGELSVRLDPGRPTGQVLYVVTATVRWKGVVRERELQLTTLVAERK